MVVYTYDPSYSENFKVTKYIKSPYLNEYINSHWFLAMSSFT